MNGRLADLRREYGDQAIDVDTLHDDPWEQFRQWFHQAREAEVYEPNGMALATVSADGGPSCRTVLLKDISDGGFVFFTDYTSQKGRDIAANPHVALLFWWDRIHRQVRIEGVAAKVDKATSDAYFASRPLASRRSTIASSQTRIVESRQTLVRAVEEVVARFPDDNLPRPATWGGYRVTPHVFEFWQGRRSRLHDRVQYLPDDVGAWTRQRLSP